MSQHQELKNKLYTAIVGKSPSEISAIVKEVISEYLDSILPPLPPITVTRDPNHPTRAICNIPLYPWMLDDADEPTN